jgi:hypothetical protein
MKPREMHTLNADRVDRPASKHDGVTRTSHMTIPGLVASTPHHIKTLYHYAHPLSTTARIYTVHVDFITHATVTRWRQQRNTKMFRNATASKEQATANRLPHTRPNLCPETLGLRMTMCQTILRYADHAVLRIFGRRLTYSSSAAPSQKQLCPFACNSSVRSTRSSLCNSSSRPL